MQHVAGGCTAVEASFRGGIGGLFRAAVEVGASELRACAISQRRNLMRPSRPSWSSGLGRASATFHRTCSRASRGSLRELGAKRRQRQSLRAQTMMACSGELLERGRGAGGQQRAIGVMRAAVIASGSKSNSSRDEGVGGVAEGGALDSWGPARSGPAPAPASQHEAAQDGKPGKGDGEA